MPSEEQQDARIELMVATAEQMRDVYRLRHDVYAVELEQFEPNAERFLPDASGIESVYITARYDSELIGFIGVTPPGSPRLSIDRYLDRGQIPIELGESTYEFRALTVKAGFRNRISPVSIALLYAAFRWVEARGGNEVIAFGRRQVLDFYLKFGFSDLQRSFACGAVEFAVIHGRLDNIRAVVERYASLQRRIESDFDWRIDIDFHGPADCYHGGAFFDAIGNRFERLERRERVINADVLDAWFPPAPSVVRALGEHLPWVIATSPPTRGEGLLDTLAEVRDVERENLLLGAGSSSLIFLALREWLTPASKVLILEPSYGEYSHVLENVIRCRVDRLSLDRDARYRVDTAELERRLQSGYDWFVWVNPNSPTGQHLPRAQVERILDRLPAGTRVWLDETYVEYAGADQSLERVAARSENVVVCKSMSKVYALSGLRVAYLCGAAHRLEGLRAATPPWSVGLPGQIAAVHALQASDYYEDCYLQTHRLRDDLAAGLQRIGIDEIVSGVANFILFHLPPEGMNADTLVAACRDRGLYLRDISSMGKYTGRHALRIAVKDAATNRRMLEIIDEVLSRSTRIARAESNSRAGATGVSGGRCLGA